jgi:NADPH:quinone reductase-like Zn-dependent oxidoreductase
MKAVFYHENGGPEVMQFGELPDPVIGPDTVCLKVEWVSIEGGDLLNRLVSPPPHPSFVPGYQAAGIVVAVGSDVTKFRAGDRAVGFNWNGSHADLFAVPEQYAYPIPEGVETRVAATIPIPFGTAYDALVTYGRLQAGETVLIQGAAGGVGLAAVQIAAQLGATVIGTASGTDRIERLRQLGLEHGIDYRTQSIAEECDRITGGAGVDMVLDLAGGQDAEDLIASLKRHGRYMTVGASTGSLPSFGFFEIINKALMIKGVTFGLEMHTQRAHDLLSELFARVRQGHLTMPIDREFPLCQAVAAHEHVANGHPLGRVLLRP